MKTRLALSFLLMSSFMATASGCDKIPFLKKDSKYVLEDTWGEDGNWGNQPQINKQAAKSEPAKPKEEEPKAPEAPKAEVKEEAPVEEAEVPQPEEEVQEAPPVEMAKSYENNKYKYSIVSADGWEMKAPVGNIGAYYFKNKDGNNLSFSVGVVKKLASQNLNNNFKQAFTKELKNSFNGLEILENKDETINGKKAWVISYSFSKNEQKFQQKQAFIPHGSNTLVMNWISTEDGFFTGSSDFNELSSNLEFN